MFDYFYGQSGEMFSYFRVPKILFRDIKFKDLSTDAKTLYGILLDRMSLSVKNGWLDEQGRVYIIFPVQEVMDALGCADNKATKLFRELEKFGLIERKRRGLVRELRLMQCYLMPDETALRELSEQVIEKLKRLTDAEFAGLEFPMN